MWGTLKYVMYEWGTLNCANTYDNGDDRINKRTIIRQPECNLYTATFPFREQNKCVLLQS